MAIVLDMAKEFGYKVSTFHHAVESYKIADLLRDNDVCSAVWADWWGFKLEAYDGIEENIALVDRAPGGCAIVHSDSSEGIQRLNQEAAKVIASSKRVNIDITPEHAIRWLTSNAAKALRIDDRTGSLQTGKMADVVVWNGMPFSTYAKAEKVYIDGALLYERGNRALQPRVDFILGQEGQP
jgi:imidazolonepropionase-like amidohydrolase